MGGGIHLFFLRKGSTIVPPYAYVSACFLHRHSEILSATEQEGSKSEVQPGQGKINSHTRSQIHSYDQFI